MSEAAASTDRQRLAAIARQAMLDRGFAPSYPDAAVAEAERVTAGELADDSDGAVADLRHLLWCSIDNASTRDLDQLTAAEPAAPAAPADISAVRQLVAIADVDVAVPRGGAIDAHARQNTTSVYATARTFHMLPERLSTGLTSLHEGQDRLAVVLDMTVGADGEVGDVALRRALVRNRARLVYGDVAAWLDGDAGPPAALARVDGLAEALALQDEVARRLERRRRELGAIQLDRRELRPVFDGDDLVGFADDGGGNRATALIQSLMVAANSATARFLEGRGCPSLRRVVGTPARWPRLVELAARCGERLPDEPDARALGSFLARRRELDPERHEKLSLAVVKLLGSGEYVVDLPERPAPAHFGLAERDYAHTTAPNRRYPDLVNQRLVKATLAGRPGPYDAAELDDIAARCTRMEDEARRVERQVVKAAAALLLADRVGERFAATVTGVTDRGTWVRLDAPPVEGKLERGASGLDVGDELEVELVATDVERGFIDFARV